MFSLWTSAMFKSIYVPRKYLVAGRYVLTNYRLNRSVSDKPDNTNDFCRPKLPQQFRLPPPPDCAKSELQRLGCQSQFEEGKDDKSKKRVCQPKQYTLVKDLAKKGYEVFRLIKDSNEYDFAKEKVKLAVLLTVEYGKKYAAIIQNTISEQVKQMKSKADLRNNHEHKNKS